jgi:hypothetical protein
VSYIAQFAPSQTVTDLAVARRRARGYQGASRGDKQSARTKLENAAILMALEAGEITEGIACRALELDRLSIREMRLRLTASGAALAMALTGRTLEKGGGE